jgi:hypothetical protein
MTDPTDEPQRGHAFYMSRPLDVRYVIRHPKTGAMGLTTLVSADEIDQLREAA